MKNIRNSIVLLGLIALISSCGKEVLPSPSGCNSTSVIPSTTRTSNSEEESNGSVTDDGSTPLTDSLEIVGGGDDDRDGGGIVGGGDDDRDGGTRIMGGGQPRR